MLNGPDKHALLACSRCPRLVVHRRVIEQQHPSYHNKPVPAWGDRRGRVLVVGLAPGLHGAARTGKAFIGDASGTLLFSALEEAGFCRTGEGHAVSLNGVTLTNAVKCLPPKNAPTTAETNNCLDYLCRELDTLAPPRSRLPRVIVALGGTAYRAVGKALSMRLPLFQHGLSLDLSLDISNEAGRKLHLVASYHPSRLNVNTGRLTKEMFHKVFKDVAALT